MINSETRRSLRFSTLDGTAFSVMVGIGETFFPAFLLAIGMGEITTGILGSLPMVVGAVLQLVSPQGVKRLGSAKKWMLICALIQTLSFIPLIILALKGSGHFLLLFLAIMMYWAGGLGTGAAWNAWMAKLVPATLRTPYFATRTRICQFGVLAGLLGGSLLAQMGRGFGQEAQFFAALFAIAMVARLVSIYALASKVEPKNVLGSQVFEPTLQVIKDLLIKRDGKVLKYLLFVQISVNISGPFFAPYMLKELALNYHEYMLLVSTTFLTRIFVLPLIGRWARHSSSARLLKIGGLLVIPAPSLWMISDNMAVLLLAQIAAGFAWAVYELGMTLSFFEDIPEKKRTSVLTVFNLGNAIAMAVGGLVGGKILAVLGVSKTSYFILFGVSSVARIFALFFLTGLKEMKGSVRPVFTRVLQLRAEGSVGRPLIASLDQEGDNKQLKPKPKSSKMRS